MTLPLISADRIVGFVARGSTSPTAAESAWLSLGVLVPPGRSGDGNGGEDSTDGMGADDGGGGSVDLASLLSVGVASAILAATTTAITFAAWVKRCAPPRLFFKDTAFNRNLLKSMPILLRTYIPNLLSWNAHTAGFFGYVKLPGGFRPRKFERITMADGGTVCLSWTSTPVDGDSIVLLLPGINNDASMPVRTLPLEPWACVTLSSCSLIPRSIPLCDSTCVT